MTLEVTQHQTAAAADAEATQGSSRRTVLRAAGVGGAVVAAGLTAAACGSSSNNSASSGNNPPPATGGGSSASASSGSGGSGGSVLAKTSDVPVDGGTIVTTDGGTVITQPAAGTYKAFTAICTHAGCTVGTVADNKIMCPCHGSVYSAMDGSVIQGPAPAPLAAKQITVSGGQITLKA